MPDVSMPQLGETVADGTVTKWFKKVGDVVVRGEALFEVSTDKVDTEIPAPADGVLTSILVKEGTTVDVGTVLCVIGGDGTPSATSDVHATTSSPVPAPSAPVSATSNARESRADKPQLSPVVRRMLGEHNVDASQVTGTGPQGRITREDILAFVALDAVRTTAGASALSQSPVVRRLLSEHNLDSASIVGTGPDGRITRRDVEAAIERVGAPSTPRLSGDEVVPFTRIRRLTAEHMVQSKATSAHTLMVKEVDYEHVETVRRDLGAAFKQSEGFTLTYLPFNAMAVLAALREFPHLNASVGDNELIVHHDLNLGIAVDLDGDGLVVPVVHRADSYDLRSVARKMRELAVGARTKKLTLDDVMNGTFTITNPGPFATLLTGAIINQPQVAILSTDGVSRKPVVLTGPDGSESIAIHSMGILALTFDHRAVDGAYAARFLARVGEVLGTRDWASEL
jgi:2-oxoglutarate dehydrogenase E2 component (dihydrolipoamide succinyltransferase)